MKVRTPNYRLHKASGQAVVTLDGRDHYLSVHQSQVSLDEYRRMVAEWIANGNRRPGAEQTDLSISELILAFYRHAEGYYWKTDGSPTSELGNIAFALKPLRELYEHTFAQDFGPLALKSVRQTMIDKKIVRTSINRNIGRIVRMFRWAVENEMVPPSMHHALRAVAGLRYGRSNAKESKPVKPVADAFIEQHDSDLFVAHNAVGEMKYLLRQLIPLPKNWFDTLVAFRYRSNEPHLPEAGLSAALHRMGMSQLAPPATIEIRNRILDLCFDPAQASDRQMVVDCCFQDCGGALSLYERLFRQIDPRIMVHWAEYLKAVARMELRGIPVDLETVGMIDRCRPAIKEMLIEAANRVYLVFRDGQLVPKRIALSNACCCGILFCGIN